MKLKKTIQLPLLLGLLFWTNFIYSQQAFFEERNNDGLILALNFNYALQTPGGDLKDRFGKNNAAGGGLDFITSKNFIFGAGADYLFGKKVKTDVIANLRNPDGLIFADDYSISDVQLRERGLSIRGHVGKLFPLFQANKRSGIRLTLGVGFLQHKIRIQEGAFQVAASLNGPYKKGYDRLSNGLSLTQFIGYQHFSRNRMVNFMAGFEVTEAFTQNRRSFNFDTRSAETEKRLDLLFGFKFGWTLPFFIKENADELRY